MLPGAEREQLVERTRLIPVLLGALALAFVLLPGDQACGISATEAGEPMSAWDQAEQPPVQLPPISRGKPKYARLDSELNGLIELLSTKPEDEVARRGPISQGSSVAVSIRLDPDAAPGIERALLARGGIVANKLDDVMEAYVPVRSLAALNVIPGVLFVRSIIPPASAVTSEGATVHNATNWNIEGYTGAGVKVGIIDTGFAGYYYLIGSDVPAPAGVRCYLAVGVFTSDPEDCYAGDNNHGTAVAESLVDIAPNVTLYLANPSSWLDLASTAQWMVDQGVRVINHSVGWQWVGPGDGTSKLSGNPLSTVDSVVSQNVAWVNAAGNQGHATWSGTMADFDFDDLLEYPDDGSEVNHVYLGPSHVNTFQLRWSDNWLSPSPVTDLDFYILNEDREVIWGSEDDQSVSGVPMETFSYAAYSSGQHFLVIKRHSGPIPAWIEVQAFDGESAYVAAPYYRTFSHSITVPAESANPGLLAVGAAAWNYTDMIELYSGRGPTRDGRIKPDIVGADKAATVSWGYSFPGTSQASAHVAGLAALVIERYPSKTPAETASYLKSNAFERGEAGPDNTWGYGFAYLPSAPATKLAFIATPVEGLPGVPFQVQPKVASQTAAGATVTTDIVRSVVLSKAAGPGTLTCTGGLIKNTVNGVATFSGCAVSAPGVYTLLARASGLTSATSTSFTIYAGPVIARLDPPNMIVNGSSFTLQVYGANFLGTSLIRFNGVNRSTGYVDGNHLQTSVSAAEILAPGPITVTVFTWAVGESNEVVFLVYDTWSFVPGLSKN